MSYDVYMNHQIGEKVYRIIEVGNSTSNIRAMLNEAFRVEDWKFIDGMLGKDVLISLQNGVAHMEGNPDKFKKMNPVYGWGNYESCLSFLKQILEACENNPDLTIEISY